jgi:hypothetical protein
MVGLDTMTFRAIALLAASIPALGSPAAAQSSSPPFAFEDVDFASDCSPNAAFDRLLTLLLPKAPAVPHDTVPVIDEPLLNAAPGAVAHVLHLGREVEWHGLRLVEVRLFQGIESGPTNHSLVFADSPQRVRAVWNARGWSLPGPGETRVLEDEVIVTAVGIEAKGEFVAVTCFVD